MGDLQDASVHLVDHIFGPETSTWALNKQMKIDQMEVLWLSERLLIYLMLKL